MTESDTSPRDSLVRAIEVTEREIAQHEAEIERLKQGRKRFLRAAKALGAS